MSITKKAVGRVTGPANMAQVRFNEPACADKMTDSGLNYFYGASNAEGLLGDVAAGASIPKFRPIKVCNSTVTALYVAFGDSGLAAPTGGGDGVMIPPNSCMMLASGDNIRIRSSAAGIFAYVAEDNIIE